MPGEVMTEPEKTRLQASLSYWNTKAITEDATYRASIRAELANQNRINILSAWAGDIVGVPDEL